MGIKERQERDREAVSRSILDAARELFVTEGYRNVSIRKIAEKIEYSPAAIYGYFPSKDDIFYALAEEGFRLLHRTHAGPVSPRSWGVTTQRGDTVFVHVLDWNDRALALPALPGRWKARTWPGGAAVVLTQTDAGITLALPADSSVDRVVALTKVSGTK